MGAEERWQGTARRRNSSARSRMPRSIPGLPGVAGIPDEALRKAEIYIEAEEGAANQLIGFARRVRHRHRGRDVAVPSLHGDRRRPAAVHRIPDHCDAAAALHPRRIRPGALLPAVSVVEALPQPHPMVRCRRGGGRGRDPDLRHRGRRGFHRPRDRPQPDRCDPRDAVHRPALGSNPPHHRLDRPGGFARLHRLRHGGTVSAAAVDASRLRHRPAGRAPVHHARRHFRHSGRRVIDPDHPVHDLRRVPAAFRRRQILHRFLAAADGQQAERRRPHRGAVVVPARRPVGVRRRHHGDGRRRRLSDDAAGRIRQERRRRAAGGGRARRDHLAAGAGRGRVPDRGVPQDQLPRRDLDGGDPDLPLLPVAPVHGRARRPPVRRRSPA